MVSAIFKGGFTKIGHKRKTLFCKQRGESEHNAVDVSTYATDTFSEYTRIKETNIVKTYKYGIAIFMGFYT